MTGLELLLLLGLVGGAVCLALLWVAHGMTLRLDGAPPGVDPILGTRDRVAIYRASGPLIRRHSSILIPMPDHLDTRDEMVAWMTKELPRLVEEATGPTR